MRDDPKTAKELAYLKEKLGRVAERPPSGPERTEYRLYLRPDEAQTILESLSTPSTAEVAKAVEALPRKGFYDGDGGAPIPYDDPDGEWLSRSEVLALLHAKQEEKRPASKNAGGETG